MPTNGQALLQGFSEYIGDWDTRTTTSAGEGTGLTVLDTLLARYGNGAVRDFYVRIRHDSDSSDVEIRRISSFTSTGGVCTVAPKFTAQIGSGVGFELHRYDPADKFLALDKASALIIRDIFAIVKNDTITADGRTNVFSLPSGIDWGPTIAILEERLPTTTAENLLQSPQLDILTGWTAATLTAALKSRASENLIVPKHNETCTTLTLANGSGGTYTQTAANLSSDVTTPLTAFRGQKLYGGVWAYSTEASKIRLNLIDDSGTTNGSYHAGNGWEYLEVNRTIGGANATTLSFQIEVASTANDWTGHVQNAIFRVGPIPDFYPDDRVVEVERDSETGLIWLRDIPDRGLQIRLYGKDVLADLGSTAATQITNTKEVTAPATELLYAKAAEVLLGWDFLNAPTGATILERILVTRDKAADLRKAWPYTTRKGGFVSPYHR